MVYLKYEHEVFYLYESTELTDQLIKINCMMVTLHLDHL